MDTPDEIKNILNSIGDIYSRSRGEKSKSVNVQPQKTKPFTDESFMDPQQKYVINELVSKYGYTKERALELWSAIK